MPHYFHWFCICCKKFNELPNCEDSWWLREDTQMQFFLYFCYSNLKGPLSSFSFLSNKVLLRELVLLRPLSKPTGNFTWQYYSWNTIWSLSYKASEPCLLPSLLLFTVGTHRNTFCISIDLGLLFIPSDFSLWIFLYWSPINFQRIDRVFWYTCFTSIPYKQISQLFYSLLKLAPKDLLIYLLFHSAQS